MHHKKQDAKVAVISNYTDLYRFGTVQEAAAKTIAIVPVIDAAIRGELVKRPDCDHAVLHLFVSGRNKRGVIQQIFYCDSEKGIIREKYAVAGGGRPIRYRYGENDTLQYNYSCKNISGENLGSPNDSGFEDKIANAVKTGLNTSDYTHFIIGINSDNSTIYRQKL